MRGDATRQTPLGRRHSADATRQTRSTWRERGRHSTGEGAITSSVHLRRWNGQGGMAETVRSTTETRLERNRPTNL